MSKSAVLAVGFFVLQLQLSAQDFKSNLPQPVMKYQALRDTDKDPNVVLREEGLKTWQQKRDTILNKAKKLLDEKDYTGVNQLLFPFDFLEPEDARFYEYLGKSYYYSGLYQPALDCFKISFEQKKNNELLFFIGHSLEKTGNEKEAIKYYKKGAKEGIAACQAKLGE
jgi:tetratricopeptide (TPR) repeat protein